MTDRPTGFLSAFATAVVFQLCFALIASPGDGYHWLRYTILYLALFDIVIYLVCYSDAKHRQRREPLASWRWFVAFGAASVAIAIAGTYLTGYLRLP